MFTGIIESLGTITELVREGTNVHLTLTSDFTHELKVDQSLAHDGVCLTVVNIDGVAYTVTAIDETMKRTNLGERRVGDQLNLERCMRIGDRLDGHIVQGHVDTTAKFERVEPQDGSWKLFFNHAISPDHITVEKGSITVNGVSLTVVDSSVDGFSIAVIPYTWEHTNLGKLQPGQQVNLEFDVVGKYVARMLGDRLK